MKILNGSTASDISGIQDVHSYSPEYNITTQKYKVMKIDDFPDLFPLPTNLTKSVAWSLEEIPLSALT